MVWKDYRKALGVFQATNQRCIYIHKKRERLSSQIHALGMGAYTLEAYPKGIHQRKEGLSSPQCLTTHNFINNAYSNQDQFEALKQKL